MSTAQLPQKAANLLVKTLASHTILGQTQLKFEDVFEELLGPAGFSQAEAMDTLQAIQKVQALAVVNDYNEKDFGAVVDRLGPQAGSLREALTSWWAENREGVRAHLIKTHSDNLGRPTLDSLEWKVTTIKGSSLPASGADPSSGAMQDDRSTGFVALVLTIDDHTSATDSTSSKRTLTVRATKEQLADMLAQVEAARKEGERIVAEGSVR
jgi:hypothetical protein